MADIKNIVLAIITVVFMCNVLVYVYAQAVSNSTEYGSYPDVSSNPLTSKIAGYNNKTQEFETYLSNSTKSASTTPPSTDSTGLGLTLSAGGQAVALVFDSLGLMTALAGEVSKAFISIGIPSFVVSFGILFIGGIVILAILGAVYKWFI